MKKTIASLAVISALTAQASLAKEHDAKTIVGQVYGGAHYSLFQADSDRNKNIATQNGIIERSLDDGDGFGLELGYRFSAYNELRIKYTDLSIDAHQSQYGEQDGSSVALDLLHFPNQKSAYLIGGFKRIDLGEKDVSANLGLGYRHYFSNRFAAYVEGKGHYQFDHSYKDWTAAIGLIYFFGENTTQPAKKAVKNSPTQPVKQVAQVNNKDTDKDGVWDGTDRCPNTPQANVVDKQGCTVFTKKTSTMELAINFDNNKAIVKSEYQDEVERAAKFLTQYPHVDITIEGHSSSIGSAQYNKTLSTKRAKAVKAMLVEQFGVDETRVTAVGYGEERLLNDANTAEAHAQNRRIYAIVNATKKEALTKQ